MAKKRKSGFEHIDLSGWKPRKYDHRDFQLSDYITLEMRLQAATITAYDWPDSKILDQGNTPHCVGYAWAGYGIAEPVADPWDNSMGEDIYYRAKVIDGEPGGENGSTTLSGVKAFMQLAVLDGYAFASKLDDIIVWILTKSPVIVGTNWEYNMFYPDADGLVHTGGGVAGGHEYMITGVDTVARQFHCANSWGTGFGVNGTFKIGFDDFQSLWDSGGDAVTAVEITGTPIPPTPTPGPGCILGILKWLVKAFGG